MVSMRVKKTIVDVLVGLQRADKTSSKDAVMLFADEATARAAIMVGMVHVRAGLEAELGVLEDSELWVLARDLHRRLSGFVILSDREHFYHLLVASRDGKTHLEHVPLVSAALCSLAMMADFLPEASAEDLMVLVAKATEKANELSLSL